MIMANLRPRCSLPIASRMKGNFWTVVITIRLPPWSIVRRSAELSAWPTTEPTCANCLMVSRICLSSILRSVTTITESKTTSPSRSSPISWWASQAMELDLPLPAECWIRYFAPAPSLDASAKSPLTTSKLVVTGPYLLPPLAPGLLVLRLNDLGVVLDDVGEPVAGENLLPQVVGLEAVWIRLDCPRRRSIRG